jgi:hypothetical protein
VFEFVVVAVLVVWLAFAFFVQFPFAARRVEGLWSYFLPHWSLFTAPQIYLDVKLCYREQLGPVTFSRWQQLPFPRRPWTETIWQPERRFGKLVGDAAAKLVQLRLTGERSGAASTRPYRLLYAYVRDNAPVLTNRPIQFGILAGRGVPEGLPKIIFQSDVHQS